MKLTKILLEMDTTKNLSTGQPTELSKDQIRGGLKEISEYNSHSDAIRRSVDLNEVAEKIARTVDLAERIALTRMSEGDNWFDKKTCERNMNEARKYSSELQKVARVAQENLNQMEALYEEVGQKLNRYFDIKDGLQKQPITQPPIVGENNI